MGAADRPGYPIQRYEVTANRHLWFHYGISHVGRFLKKTQPGRNSQLLVFMGGVQVLVIGIPGLHASQTKNGSARLPMRPASDLASSCHRGHKTCSLQTTAGSITFSL